MLFLLDHFKGQVAWSYKVQLNISLFSFFKEKIRRSDVRTQPRDTFITSVSAFRSSQPRYKQLPRSGMNLNAKVALRTRMARGTNFSFN